jgi:tetratricopeptide (TPR) repeat protein
MDASVTGAERARQSLAILSIDPAKSGEKERGLLDQAVARQKDDPVALARLAAIYEREGNVDKALAIYEAALTANPSNTSAALSVIRVYRARNELAKALELAKTTRRLAPTDGKVAHVLGRLAFEGGDYHWSVGVLQEAARRQESNADVVFDLAEANYSIGQVAAAESGFKEALTTGQGTFQRAAKAREYLELIKIAQNPAENKAEAGKVDKVLLADKRNVPAIFAKAALDGQKGDIQGAKRGYNEALTRFPEFTPAKRELTLLYAAHPDDDKKALELAGKAREAYPTDPDVAKAFGIILFRQANYTRAVTLFRESARNRTTDAELMYYLGMSQHHLKDQPGSKSSLERALELGLSGGLAEEARRTLTPPKK